MKVYLLYDMAKCKEMTVQEMFDASGRARRDILRDNDGVGYDSFVIEGSRLYLAFLVPERAKGESRWQLPASREMIPPEMGRMGMAVNLKDLAPSDISREFYHEPQV